MSVFKITSLLFSTDPEPFLPLRIHARPLWHIQDQLTYFFCHLLLFQICKSKVQNMKTTAPHIDPDTGGTQNQVTEEIQIFCLECLFSRSLGSFILKLLYSLGQTHYHSRPLGVILAHYTRERNSSM